MDGVLYYFYLMVIVYTSKLSIKNSSSRNRADQGVSMVKFKHMFNHLVSKDDLHFLFYFLFGVHYFAKLFWNMYKHSECETL